MLETLWSDRPWNWLIASEYSSVSAIAFSKIEGLEVTPLQLVVLDERTQRAVLDEAAFEIVKSGRLAARFKLPERVHAAFSAARASCSRAAASTFSVVKPNFFSKSLIGAEAPKECMPMRAPLLPT